MQDDNICKFVAKSDRAPAEVQIVNFVWEKTDIAASVKVCSVYGLYVVLRGDGSLIRDGKAYDIEKGDVFFLVPGNEYAIRNKSGLEYAYISFLGLGAPALLRRIADAGNIYRLSNEGTLIGLWETALQTAHPNNIDLVAESVLLFTAALWIKEREKECPADTIVQIEAYIRSHFSCPTLSLKKTAQRFGYNEKYLSKLFYRTTGMRFCEYVANLRLNAACAFMQNKKASVKEAAEACGFSDALYFSKAFKKKFGVTPSQFARKA